MQAKVTLADSQSVEFLNTKSIDYNFAGHCGSRVFTWTPSKPSYMQLDSSLAVLTLSTNNVSDVGIHWVEFTVGMLDYPDVPKVTKIF
jgi:hypothetical protein